MTRPRSYRVILAGAIALVAWMSGPGVAPALAGTTAYTYDELGRLKTVTKTTGFRVTYHYDAAGNRSSVAIVDVQAPSVPGTLSGFAASGTQINLSWGAATDNVGVTRYRVYRNGGVVGTPTATSYSDTGLTSAGSYTYRVTALDAAGNEGASSNTISVSTPDTVPPTVPTALSGSAVSGTQINLIWAASTDNVGVTGYKVYRNGVQVGTPSSTSYSDTGLSQYTSYTYTAAAYDARGNTSAASSAFVIRTLDTTAPSVPTGVSAAGVSGSQVNVSWTASTDNVGVTGYRVFRNGVHIASPTVTSFSDTGLAQVTSYSYTVAAVDAAGNVSGQSAAAVGITRDVSAPSTPTGLSAAAASGSQINLSWAASTDNVGVTGYRVFRNGVQIASPSVTSFSDTGLAQATSYSYTVAAVDAAGNVSAQSGAAVGTTRDVSAPSTPAGLSAAAASGSQINLAWSASTDNVGVAAYRVFRNGVQIASPSSTSFADTGLAQATSYSYTVAAVDAAGNVSALSAAAVAMTWDVSAPSTPAGLSAAAASGSQINLAWSASTDNVGVTGYRVFRNGVHIASPSSTSFADTGLAQATSYSYTVAAVDAAGNVSAQSGAAVGTTWDVSAPSTPTGLSAAAVSGSQINLSWAGSSDNVGVTGYRVFRNGVHIASPSSTSFADTGLSQYTSYTYSVAAHDAAGNVSAASGAVAATTFDTSPPSVPTGVGAGGVSGSQVNVWWAASSDNVGVAGYRVYRNGVHIASPSSTSFADTGLSQYTSYTYTVTAYDAAGNTSAASGAAVGTTFDASAPTTPTGLSAAAASGSQINLSWAASSDNVGVAGYYVYRGGSYVGATASTSYSDTGLSSETTYSYTVAAYDGAGNVSGQSGSASAYTPDVTPPTTPTGLSAVAASSSVINLSWGASTDNLFAGYRIYRNGSHIATTSTATTYEDAGLAASTMYSYYVTAYDGAGNVSAASNTASATTQSGITAPGIPTNVRKSPATGTGRTFSILWDAPTGAIDHYTLEETQQAPGSGVTTYNTGTNTFQSFTKPNAYLEVVYRVRACATTDESYCSPYSGVVFKLVCPTTGCP